MLFPGLAPSCLFLNLQAVLPPEAFLSPDEPSHKASGLSGLILKHWSPEFCFILPHLSSHKLLSATKANLSDIPPLTNPAHIWPGLPILALQALLWEAFLELSPPMPVACHSNSLLAALVLSPHSPESSRQQGRVKSIWGKWSDLDLTYNSATYQLNDLGLLIRISNPYSPNP